VTIKILTVPLGDRSYDIFFGQDIYPFFQEWICRFFPGGSVFVVTDRNVDAIYGGEIARWLAGIPHDVLALSPGEENKTWETVREIYAFLARGSADREALVVAFGGGVVGDLAGFAAATFLRGVPHIQIPTTLLAQVDSSVGGKTGFNLPEGKNLVGAFHQPRAVFIDQTFLKTLDSRHMRAGMAEVVKCAVAGDADLWETLSGRAGRWEGMSSSEWEAVIRAAVAFKIAVVAQDERESSARRVLNLGHTIGHALEQAAGYGDLLHGEAVAMGLAWEAILMRRLGETPPDVEERIVGVLRDMGFALDVPDLPLSSIAAAVGMDKKRVASDIALPVVPAPGRCVIKRVPISRIRTDLPAIRAEIRKRLREEEVSQDEREMRDRIERGEGEAAVASLEKRVAADPRNLGAMILLAESYRLLGNRPAAWETIKAALDQDPANVRAQRLARAIEEDLRGAAPGEAAGSPPPLEDVLLLEDGVFALRHADEPHEIFDERAISAVPETMAAAEVEVEASGAAEPTTFEAEAATETGPVAKADESAPQEDEEARPSVKPTTEVHDEARSSVAETGHSEEEEVPLDRRESAVGEREAAEVAVEAPPAGQEAVEGEESAEEEDLSSAGSGSSVSDGSSRVEEERPGSTIRTVTMATLYWNQGDRETAHRIVEEILDADPGDERALSWLRAHPADEPTPASTGDFSTGDVPGPPAGAGDSVPDWAAAEGEGVPPPAAEPPAAEARLTEEVEAPLDRGGGVDGGKDAVERDAERALIAFLEAVTKEYGYDLSRSH
jgi:3-dehydroquinate synthase